LNLFELFVKIGVEDQASSKIGNITSKLGGGLKTAAKIGTAAVSVASGAIVALTKQAVESYAEYEQLIGGVETLFKNSADTVQQYAANAYKTAGLSANEYMSTVTSFSASVLQSLGGDTEAAAKYADMAVSDMSDNANKMGSSMESIQNAYQGFAKQNYTLLDNLKLGYGGTKGEMQRLVKDAAKIDSSIDKNSLSFGNIVKAINVVQKEMGIYGTTALEAEKTISGSISMTKSAWSNLVTGVADDNADFEQLINNFVESVGTTANNILPRVQTALEGGGKLVEKLVPVIIEQIPDIVEDTLPKMLKSGVKIIKTILQGISKDPDTIVDTVFDVINVLIDGIIDMLPTVLTTGVILIGKLAVGLVKAIPDLVSKIPQIIRAVVEAFKSNSGTFSEIGNNIVQGVWRGIQGMISWFTSKVKSFFSGIVNSVKNTLGIHSPSTVFASIGKNMAQGVGVGWDDEFDNIQDDINGSLDFSGGSVSLSSVNGGVGGRPINITQNIYAQKKSAAQLMQEARWQAQMGVLASV
jgi:phage-related protein